MAGGLHGWLRSAARRGVARYAREYRADMAVVGGPRTWPNGSAASTW